MFVIKLILWIICILCVISFLRAVGARVWMEVLVYRARDSIFTYEYKGSFLLEVIASLAGIALTHYLLLLL